MEREIASRIVRSVFDMYRAVGDCDAAVSSIESEEEKRPLVSAIGEIMRLTRQQMLLPIFSQYPDLIPEEFNRR